jgi:hypothetical protein
MRARRSSAGAGGGGGGGDVDTGRRIDDSLHSSLAVLVSSVADVVQSETHLVEMRPVGVPMVTPELSLPAVAGLETALGRVINALHEAMLSTLRRRLSRGLVETAESCRTALQRARTQGAETGARIGECGCRHAACMRVVNCPFPRLPRILSTCCDNCQAVAVDGSLVLDVTDALCLLCSTVADAQQVAATKKTRAGAQGASYRLTLGAAAHAFRFASKCTPEWAWFLVYHAISGGRRRAQLLPRSCRRASGPSGPRRSGRRRRRGGCREEGCFAQLGPRGGGQTATLAAARRRTGSHGDAHAATCAW